MGQSSQSQAMLRACNQAAILPPAMSAKDCEESVSRESSVDLEAVGDEAPPTPDPDSGAITDTWKGENRSLIIELLKQVRIGMDLSRVTFPTFILEPRSFLEKMTDFYYHSDILNTIQDLDDPYDRMVQFMRWLVSGWHVNLPKGVKKPYNPILGERFFCEFDLGRKMGSTKCMGEQVCHHPPISAFHWQNDTLKMDGDGYIRFRSRFLGNSAASYITGTNFINLRRRNETYQFGYPHYYARGIIFGTLLMETVGTVDVDCLHSDYGAQLEFKAKGFFRGEYNAVKGKIFNKKTKKVMAVLSGNWNKQIWIQDPKEAKKKNGEKELFFDATASNGVTPVVLPEVLQGPWESQRLWRDVTPAINEDNQTRATDGKLVLEDAQRACAADRKARSVDWDPEFFYWDEEKQFWFLKDAHVLDRMDLRKDIKQLKKAEKAEKEAKSATHTTEPDEEALAEEVEDATDP